MKKIFCSFALLWWYCVQPLCAQIAAYPTPLPAYPPYHMFDDELYRWWWGLTVNQVRAKIASEPDWRIGALKIEEGNNNDPDYTAFSAQLKPGYVFLFFSFFQGKLLSRSYCYPKGYALTQAWDNALQALPYDQKTSSWIDEAHHAKINRAYQENLVFYLVWANYQSKE